MLRQLIRDRNGNVAMAFAFLLPVLIGCCALALDYGAAITRKSRLQDAVDSAAISAAKELSLANTRSDAIEARARSYIESQVSNAGRLSISVEVDARKSVKVTIQESHNYFFAQIWNVNHTTLTASATARIITSNLCLLVLESGKIPGALTLQSNARLTGLDCSVFSNSKDRGGIKAADSAMVDAPFVCSAGGISGKHRHFKNPPTTDCPQIMDPLADRAPPDVGPCQFNKMEVKKGTQILAPGVYCGGLKVTNGAIAQMSAGTYIIQGGKLVVDHAATLQGYDVSIYLAGKEASFEFDYDSIISLEAPRSGNMAGILIFDDRAGKYDKHKIFSNDARVLLGTIYLPNGALYIDAQRPIADRSAYTVLITRSLELYDGPNLVLNSDYQSSNVPVPKGVGPSGATVTLSK